MRPKPKPPKPSYMIQLTKWKRQVSLRTVNSAYFLKEYLTNSLQKSRLTLTVPLAQIQTNTHYYYEAFHPNRRIYALQVPRSAIRPNCTLLKKSKSDLVFIPIGTDLNPDALQAGDFMLLSNATQTVYLTRTSPVEFVYVDSSMKVPFTSVTVAPTIVTKRHPAYYLLLPLTIPADIATAPFQIIGLWAIAVVCHQ